jgi:cell wall-associated NlpC family hydrolase
VNVLRRTLGLLTIQRYFVGFAAAVGIAVLAARATPARAQGTLDLTLDTGAPSSLHVPAPRSQPALPSRGGPNFGASFRQAPTTAPAVLAQLGTVAVTDLQIRVARDHRSRLLSVVSKGTNLAVVADGGYWWGVLMVNNTMGWVPKSALTLIDYRTEVNVPTPPTAVAPDAAPTQSASGPDVANLDSRTTALLREAFSYLGVPYVWAGNTRQGLDCSGFLCNVFGAMGVRLPRHSGDQAQVGQPVAGLDLRPGDRLYFDMGNKGEISHCGLYIGNGLFIHASTNHGGVAVDSVYKSNYRKALVAARR